MATETTDLTLDILKGIQADIAGLRRDVRDVQQSQVGLARVFQHMDARLSDMKADLETMFKMELIGQLSHFETRHENMLREANVPLSERLDRIEAKLAIK